MSNCILFYVVGIKNCRPTFSVVSVGTTALLETKGGEQTNALSGRSGKKLLQNLEPKVRMYKHRCCVNTYLVKPS